MCNEKKSLLAGILTLISLVSVLMFTISFHSVAAVTSAESFRIERGAWIRTEDPFGIRLMAKISNEDRTNLISAYGENNVIFGMLMCPADYIIDNSDLTIGSTVIKEYNESETYTDGDKFYVNKTVEPSQYEDSSDDYYTCALVGINQYNFSRPYAARAYYGVKNDNSPDYNYFYSEIYKVAPYTIASKALADESAAYEDDVKSYLKGITDYVLNDYNSAEITVMNQDGSSAFNIGDTVQTEVKIVKSDDSSKKLDTAANISYSNAVDENGKVVSLGDFTVTAYVDELKTVKATVTASNQKTFTLLDGKDTQDNIVKAAVYGKDESKAKLVWHDSYTSVTTDGTRNVTKQNVLQWTIEDGQTSSKQVEMDLSIKEELIPIAKKDVYLYFDFMVVGKVFEGYWKDPTLLYLCVPSQSGENVMIYDAPKTDLVTLYNATGEIVSTYREGQDNCNNWLTARVKLPADWIKSEYFSIGMYPASGSSYKTDVFLSNMYLSSDEINIGDMEGYSVATAPQKENFAITEFTVADTSKASFVKSETVVGGRNGVYNFAATATSAARLYLSNNVVSKLSVDGFCYLYFDLYVTEASSLCVSIRNGTSNGKAVYINQTASYSDDNFELQLYSESGEKLDKNINNYLNQWVTVAVRFKASGITKDSWGQLFYNTASSLSENIVYLDNLRIANHNIF